MIWKSINWFAKKKKKNQLTGFYMVRFFAGRYFRTGFNKQPNSITNCYLLTCIIKHSLLPWGVFVNNITLRVLINAKHKKCRNYLCEFVFSSQTQVPGSAFKSQQQLFAIFYVTFYSIFASFTIFNLNRLWIFNDGSRYGSVTRNMDQLIQV